MYLNWKINSNLEVTLDLNEFETTSYNLTAGEYAFLDYLWQARAAAEGSDSELLEQLSQ